MKNELIIKKCLKCGALFEVINDCKCDECQIKCCEEPVIELIPNSIDASFEKHIPTYEIINDEIYVKVNHVMEDDHFIMWIALVNEKVTEKVKLLVNEPAECKFKYIKGSKLYAYCNKHGLWTCDVK